MQKRGTQVLVAHLIVHHYPTQGYSSKSGEATKPEKFAIEMDRRSIAGLDRQDVINTFAGAIPQPPHSVDLSDPAKVIIVQVVRNSCTVAVMEGKAYRRLKKCNIRLCSQPPDGVDSKEDATRSQVPCGDENEWNLEAGKESAGHGRPYTPEDEKVGSKRTSTTSLTIGEGEKKQKHGA